MSAWGQNTKLNWQTKRTRFCCEPISNVERKLITPIQIVAIPTDHDFKMRNEVQVEVSFQKYNVFFKEMKKKK